MTLVKALKVKNRLIGEINKAKNILSRENARRSDSVSTVDRDAIFKEINEKTAILVRLKGAISRANIGIYEDIASLAELKSFIGYLEGIYSRVGPEVVLSGGQKLEYTWESYVTEDSRDMSIKEIQVKINVLQDQIDDYNAVTSVDFKE